MSKDRKVESHVPSKLKINTTMLWYIPSVRKSLNFTKYLFIIERAEFKFFTL